MPNIIQRQNRRDTHYRERLGAVDIARETIATLAIAHQQRRINTFLTETASTLLDTAQQAITELQTIEHRLARDDTYWLEEGDEL